MQRTLVRVVLAALAAVSLVLGAQALPAAAAIPGFGTVHGTVTDAATGQPISSVCIYVGPVHLADRCSLTTNAQGQFTVDLPQNLDWPFYFCARPTSAADPCHWSSAASYKSVDKGNQKVTMTNPDIQLDVAMSLDAGSPPPSNAGCSGAMAGTPTQTIYMPNVTKTLGGAQGFQTPFIVQNSGITPTTLEVSFNKFSDGSCVARRTTSLLAPGASYADVPNNDTDLPDNSQFSVTVRSFGASVVSVVNQHKGSIEADAYSAVSAGANTVYLPNVVRSFYGFHSPAIIQNLGQVPTVVTATYQSFDGSAPTKVFTRTISPGQSQFIEPNSDDPNLGAPGLVNGKQYAVTMTSPQPISVVLNTHNDDPGVAQPVFYSANGISTGAPTVYGAYAVKNANGNRVSTIVVQNLSAGPVTPSLTFTPLGGGATQTFSAPAAVPAGGAWAYDPRFISGIASTDQTKLCSAPSATCLGNGEYSFTADGTGGTVAAMVNVIGPDSAMGYTASPTPAANYDLPNVLASYGGWTTPIYLQSVTATSATLTWTPFTGGAATTQTVSLTPGATTRIDPNASAPQGRQYGVTVTSGGGTLAAIVMELHNAGGDNAMIYGGFPIP